VAQPLKQTKEKRYSSVFIATYRFFQCPLEPLTGPLDTRTIANCGNSWQQLYSLAQTFKDLGEATKSKDRTVQIENPG